MSHPTYQIHSVFKSHQGEVNALGVGSPAIFLRFFGCPCRCYYCDTRDSWNNPDENMEEVSFDELCSKVQTLSEITGCRNLALTGGEPLLQPVGWIVAEFIDKGWEITVETNGTVDIPRNLCSCHFIVDYKMQYPDRFVWSNLPLLTDTDYIKVPLAYWEEFKDFLKVYDRIREINDMVRIAVAPIHGFLEPAKLKHWLDVHKLGDVHLNVQMHKYIGIL